MLYYGTPGVRVDRQDIRVVGTNPESLEKDARDAVNTGADRIELCGAMGPAEAHMVSVAAGEVAGGPVPVGLARDGNESVEKAAAVKQAFDRGEDPPGVFLYATRADGTRSDVLEHVDGRFVPVSEPADLTDAVRTFAAGLEGRLGFIEIYNGLGTSAAAQAVRAAEGEIPVGYVGYDAVTG